ncbi:MAG: hypothetical protein ACF8XB_17320 [Planctomycetota bacterium JB042]
MRLLISAPGGPPRFVGEQLLAAARRLGHEAALFDHPASRDPTLELPAAARRVTAEIVLLVEPDREDPATLEAVRARGSRTVAWFAPAADDAPRWRRARRIWIARAADAVFVTDEAEVAGRTDRSGRPARVVGRGHDPEALGIVVGARSPSSAAGERIALRAADDPLRISTAAVGAGLIGLGDARAFPSGVPVHALEAAGGFAARISGRTYVVGGRVAGGGPPSVFDDAAAARAAGATIERWAAHAAAADGTEPPGEPPEASTFERRLEVLLAPDGDRS